MMSGKLARAAATRQGERGLRDDNRDKQMRAILCKDWGEPEELTLGEATSPVAGPGQVTVRMRAAGVNFADIVLVRGQYQEKPDLPFSPGLEGAGEILAVGDGVTGWAPGDRVMVVPGVGAFAEEVAVAASDVLAIPEGMDFTTAAAFPVAYGTSHIALTSRAALQAGETLLVLGAGGNVGIAAVELGVLMGARVIAAASSEEKLALCRERGAAMTINYRTENLKDRAKELTDGKGVDVVYDVVGGDYAEAAVRAIAWGGRFLVIGFTAGIPKLPLNLTLLKGCQVVGVFLGAMVSREPETRDGIVRDLLDLTRTGKLNPRVSKRYSLDEAPQALRDLMDRKAVGKVVVEP
jgi:NADPH2:quinone reductase